MSADLATTWTLLLLARATAILLLAAAVVFLLRRRSASARHAALALTVAGLLALPVLSMVLPRWEVAVLPSGGPAAGARAVRVRPFEPSLRTEIGGSGAAEAAATSTPLTHRTAPTPRPESAEAPSPARVARPVVEPDRPPARHVSPQVSSAVVFRGLALVWIVGAATGVLRMVRSSRLARRTRLGAAELVEPGWQHEIDEAARTLGLRGHVRLLMTDAVRVPVVHGFRSPAIVLPTSAVQWPAERRRAFLLHELAHVRRRDWPVQMLGHVARALYWPHPLAWWAVRRLRMEAERACDDCVLLTGTPPPDYAEHLLQAARDLGQAPQPAAVLAAVERSHFEDRLLALLDPQVRRGPIDGRRLVLAAAMAFAAVIGVAGLQPVASAVADTPERSARDEDGKRSKPKPPAPPLERVADKPASGVSVPISNPAAPPSAWPQLVRTVTPGPSVDEDDPVEPLADDEDTASPAAAPVSQPTTPAASAAPAASPRPVIRISTDLVQIDAVITNKDGQSIVDLGPEDIEVLEDGRRQKITHVQYVEAGPARGAVDPGSTGKDASPREPRTYVFVIDDLGLSLESSVRARRLVQAFVASGLQPRDRAAIVETSKIQRGTAMILTGDPAILSPAADAVRFVPWGRAGLDLHPARGDRTSRLDTTNRHSQLILQSVAALKNTVEALRSAPGRKAVILVSEGFTTRVSRDEDLLLRDYTATALDTLYGDTSLWSALRALTDAANRASVVIYALDPKGLQVDSIESQVEMSRDSRDAEGQPTGYAGPAQEERRQRAVVRQAREESLIEIAEQTGGIAVTSSNDLAGGLDRIVSDHSAYYLIGYAPDYSTFGPRSEPPRFHQVKVEVKRRGAKVRSRKGFYGVTDEVVAQAVPPQP